jgi:hypothetical protein
MLRHPCPQELIFVSLSELLVLIRQLKATGEARLHAPVLSGRKRASARVVTWRGDAKWAEGPTKSAVPACAEAQAALNLALSKQDAGGSALQDATKNKKDVTELPNDIGSDAGAWGASIADAQIKGRPIKVVSYETGGTCHDGTVELRTPDFAKRIPISGSNVDSEPTGYTWEELIQLHGEPFFAHVGRSGGITLYAFEQDLSAHPVCEITPSLPAQETIKSATDPEVCSAVLTGKVNGAPIDDIEPFPPRRKLLPR